MCVEPASQVHERTLQSDFLMALLKDILAKRRARGHPLKVSHPPCLSHYYTAARAGYSLMDKVHANCLMQSEHRTHCSTRACSLHAQDWRDKAACDGPPAHCPGALLCKAAWCHRARSCGSARICVMWRCVLFRWC